VGVVASSTWIEIKQTIKTLKKRREKKKRRNKSNHNVFNGWNLRWNGVIDLDRSMMQRDG
jgi:hypothetical protein